MTNVPLPILVCPSTPNSINDHGTLSTALRTSTTPCQLKQVHAKILRSGLECSSSLLSKLVLSSFSVSSSLDYALSVFYQIPKPEIHLCNMLLRELSRSDEPGKALFLYQRMRRVGLVIDRFSFPPLLKATARVSSLHEGMEIHGLSLKLGFDSDLFVQTGLLGMYAASGSIADARLVFERMSNRDVVAWNVMIDGYGFH